MGEKKKKDLIPPLTFHCQAFLEEGNYLPTHGGGQHHTPASGGHTGTATLHRGLPDGPQRWAKEARAGLTSAESSLVVVGMSYVETVPTALPVSIWLLKN